MAARKSKRKAAFTVEPEFVQRRVKIETKDRPCVVPGMAEFAKENARFDLYDLLTEVMQGIVCEAAADDREEVRKTAKAVLANMKFVRESIAAGDAGHAAADATIVGIGLGNLLRYDDLSAGRQQLESLLHARTAKCSRAEEKRNLVCAEYDREKAENPRLSKRSFARNKAATQSQKFGSERTILRCLSEKK